MWRQSVFILAPVSFFRDAALEWEKGRAERLNSLEIYSYSIYVVGVMRFLMILELTKLFWSMSVDSIIGSESEIFTQCIRIGVYRELVMAS